MAAGASLRDGPELFHLRLGLPRQPRLWWWAWRRSPGALRRWILLGCAIGVHYPIGYVDFVHLAPAWTGGIMFVIAMALSYRRYQAPPLNGGA